MMNTHGLKYVQSKGFCWVERKSEKKKQIDKGGGGVSEWDPVNPEFFSIYFYFFNLTRPLRYFRDDTVINVIAKPWRLMWGSIVTLEPLVTSQQTIKPVTYKPPTRRQGIERE